MGSRLLVVVLAGLSLACTATTSPAETLQADFDASVDAYNSGDAGRYSAYFCPSAITQARDNGGDLTSSEKLRQSLGSGGKMKPGNLTEVNIDGDTATAKVEMRFEKDPDGMTYFPVLLSFRRSDAGWKQCKL